MQTLKKSDWFHADGFPLAVERRHPQLPFGLHDHEFSELVVITGGRGVHVTDEDRWELAKGDTFVIGQSQPHDYIDIDGLSLINVLFDERELALPNQDLHGLPGYHALFRLEPAWRRKHQFRSRLRITPRELAIVLSHINQLDDELQTRRPGFRFLATSNFMLLIGFLSRCFDHSTNEASQSLLHIARCISHLETNFRNPISLGELVEISGQARRSFLRDFECATGSSPIAYLIQLRINKAAELLRDTSNSITDIAYTVGFNDSNYFTRQFRKALGTSPRTYRSLSRPGERVPA